MGDILNVAALHDRGAARATFGIRGNSFQLNKDNASKVSLLDPITQNILQLRADVILGDGTLVESRILSLEELFGYLLGMILEDDYRMDLVDDEGAQIIDDDSGYPIADNWSVRESLVSLASRVAAVESKIGDATGGIVSDINKVNYRVTTLSNDVYKKAETYTQSEVDTKLNHVFIVDDAVE